MERNKFESTYQPPSPPDVLTPNQLYVREYAQGVWIPLLQNFFGGLLGIGGLVTLIAWKAGMGIEDALILGAICGGIVFCAATAFRAFRDEARQIIAAHGERQDKATRAALEAEVEQLRRELKAARSQGVITAQYQVLMVAERLLGDYYERHLSITRARACGERGYDQTLWAKAHRLLQTAGVVDGRSNIKVSTFPEAWAKVLRAQTAGMGNYAVTEAGDVVRQK